MNRVGGYGRQHRASLVADGRDASVSAVERLLETNHLAQAQALGDVKRRCGLSLAEDRQVVTPDTPAPAPMASQPIVPDVREKEAPEIDVGAPFDQLEASVETFLRRHRERWDEKTRDQARQTVDLFFRVLRDNGSTSTDIRQSHLGAFRDLLDVLPARYGQTFSLRVLDAAGLREAGARLSREGKLSGLSVGTINRHLTHLDAYVTFLGGQGWVTAALDVAPLKPRVRRGEGKRSKAEKPPFSSFSRLFYLPPFTGSRSHAKQGWPGRHVYHSGVFYAPILLACLGARRNEICSLHVDDVFEGDDKWALKLAPNELRGLKKDWSRRVLPLPEEAVRLGFLDYTSRTRSLAQIGSPFRRD